MRRLAYLAITRDIRKFQTIKIFIQIAGFFSTKIVPTHVYIDIQYKVHMLHRKTYHIGLHVPLWAYRNRYPIFVNEVLISNMQLACFFIDYRA